MKTAIMLVLCLLFGAVLSAAAEPINAGSAMVTDASAPVAQAPPLHDPLTDPVAAVSDLKQAKRQGWAVLSFALMVMLTRLGVSLSAKHPSLAFLTRGKTHIALAAAAAFALAAYNALALGGSLYAALYAAGGVLLYSIMPKPKALDVPA